jgi:hypothetical protein
MGRCDSQIQYPGHQCCTDGGRRREQTSSGCTEASYRATVVAVECWKSPPLVRHGEVAGDAWRKASAVRAGRGSRGWQGSGESSRQAVQRYVVERAKEHAECSCKYYGDVLV